VKYATSPSSPKETGTSTFKQKITKEKNWKQKVNLKTKYHLNKV